MGFSEALGQAFVEIRADLSTLDPDLNAAEKKVNDAVKRVGSSFTEVGKTMTVGLTAPIVGIGAASLKMASDFESSFAGVLKTVNGTTDAMGNITTLGETLRQGFRDMAKEIPINVNELNKIGEAAGQLGIKSDAILDFTRVMADLSVTTNLTSDAAATGIAQIANVMGTASSDFGRFGAALVALGNDGASTEAQILEMAQRIAGAGKQVGLTEGEVLAVANALASVGIEAEAGGSAISKVMINMGVAVATGNDDLEKFATAAHMSVGEFKTLFEQDAASALNAFVMGLNQTKTEGGNMLAVLSEMGIEEVRMRDAILRLAGSGTVLTDSLKLQKTAWDENMALTKEAEQRYKTFESQLTLVINEIKDVAIELGMALIPIVKDLLTAMRPVISILAEAVKWFADLPEPIRLFVVGLAALVAAVGPVLLIIGQMITTFGALSTAMPVVIGALKLILPFLGPAGLIAAGVAAVLLVWKNWDKITEIAQAVYTGIKTWLVDRFNAVVESIKQKVGAVTGFFSNMYNAVVGNSFVPDMINGIASQFSRLNTVMVAPTQAATSGVSSLFSNLAGAVMGNTSGLMNMLQGKLQTSLTSLFGGKEGGGGLFGSLMSTGLGALLGPAGPLAPLITSGINALTGLVMKGLSKVGSFFKGLFGGPDKAELEAREIFGSFVQEAKAVMDRAQLDEVAVNVSQGWSENLAIAAVRIHDAYRKMAMDVGSSVEEADRHATQMVQRLFDATRQSGADVQKVLQQIESEVRGPLVGSMATMSQAGQQAFGNMARSADGAFDAIGMGLGDLSNQMQIVRDQFGRPITIPVNYSMSGAPSGGGGGGSSSGGGGNSVADAIAAHLAGDTSEANREARQAPAKAAVLAAIAAGNNDLKRFMDSNPGDWERGARNYGISFARGGFIPPGMVTPAMLHGGSKGEIITPIGDLERFLSDKSTAPMERSVQNTVNFNLSTPLATIDTVRQMVYDEIGPLLIDWLDGNKGGARTRMRTAMGIA